MQKIIPIYLEKRDTETEFISRTQEKSKETQNVSSAKKTKEQKRLEAEARQAVSKEHNCLKKLIHELEEQIEAYESKKEEVEFQMSLLETYKNGEYASIKANLEDFYRKWEEAQLELEEIMSQI